MALLKFKRSAVPAKIPSIADLALGELAINTYDGKVYTKKDDGTQAIVEVGGGGGVQTIASADGSVTVTGTTDIDLSVAVAAATTTIILPVRNNTGATLAKGTAVYINGALGQNPTVTKAIATSDATSAQTLGLVTANISNNAVGNVTLIGTVTNLDTSAYSDGQQLYLSPTTAGALTATKPYAPNHLVYMAVVEHAHPSQGKLFVKVQNGYEMDELHNVSAQSPANNDGLFYNTSTSLWEKKSIATALGYTPYNATNPAGYTTNVGTVTSVGGTGTVSGLTLTGGVTTSGNLTLGGTLSLTSGNVTTALGYTPANRAGDTFTGAVNFLGGSKVAANGDIYARRDNGTTGVYYFADGGEKYLYWDGGQYLFGGSLNAASYQFYGVNNVRAPIFYDSNNTAYFLDATAAGLALRTYGYWQQDSSAWAGDINGKIQYHGNSWYFSAADAWICRASNGSQPFTVNQTGIAIAAQDMRAPIFYDSNNTAYYIDAASNSVLNTLTLGGRATTNAMYYQGFTLDANTMDTNATGFTYSINAPFTGPIMRVGDAGYSLQLNAPYGANGYGLAFRTRNGDASTFNPWQYPVIYGQNGAGVGAVYGTIYYDSNNTGYYVDPNSTSNLYRLGSYTAAQYNSGDWNAAFQNTPTQSYGWHGDVSSGGPAGTWWFYESMRHSNSSNYWGTQIAWGWEDNANRLQQRNVTGGSFGGWVEYLNTSNRTYSGNLNMTGSIISTASDVRAPIFYDQNNTGYYLDASSTATSLNVAGNIVAAGNVTAYSDIRIKANVETIPSALDKLDLIRGVTYTRTDLDDKEQRYAGVIAQEIEAVLPEAVRDLGNIKAVDYNATIALLIQAVKELRDEVEALRK